MYQRHYYIEQAIIDASKAVYLATCFQHGIKEIPKYSNDKNLNDLAAFNIMPKELQRLRRTLPEAFWYWAQTFENQHQ